MVDLIEMLRSGGVTAVAFKGPTLALMAYNDLTLRQISDLDLFVRRSQVYKGVSVLQSNGYAYVQSLPTRPQAAERRLFYNHGFRRDDVVVELHWAFSEKSFPFGTDNGLWGRLARMNVLGKPVDILGLEDLILVLCVHGARHQWERVSWIADIAHLVSRHRRIDYDRLIAQARRRGAARILAVGLTLAQKLLDAPVPEKIIAEWHCGPVVQELAEECSARILSGSTQLPVADRRVVNLRFRERLRDRARCCLWAGELPPEPHRSLLPPPFRYCVKLAIAVTPNERDYSWIAVPKGLSFLYWLLRPVRLAWMRTRWFRQPS
jgi:hypothetical protein